MKSFKAAAWGHGRVESSCVWESDLESKMILGKSFNLSEPRYPHCDMEIIAYLPPRVLVKIVSVKHVGKCLAHWKCLDVDLLSSW